MASSPVHLLYFCSHVRYYYEFDDKLHAKVRIKSNAAKLHGQKVC